MLVAPQNTYQSSGGKTVYVYVIDAPSLRHALDKIPGDFMIHYWNQDRRTYTVEVVRTF